MKKIFLSILSLTTLVMQGQVVIGNTASTTTKTKDYAGLEVRSENQGILFPVVYLKNITDNTYPINAPIDGMMIYNIGSTVQQGIYIWNQSENNGKGLWVQMADTSNTISSAFLKTTQPYTITPNSNTYTSLINSSFVEVANQIGESYITDKGIKLPENSGYTLTLAMDIEKAPNTSGIDGTDLHNHKYIISLITERGETESSPVYVSSISVAGKNNNQHSVYASFSFPILLTPVILFPHIKYDGNNNSGAITIKSARIHIDRGILNN